MDGTEKKFKTLTIDTSRMISDAQTTADVTRCIHSQTDLDEITGAAGEIASNDSGETDVTGSLRETDRNGQLLMLYVAFIVLGSITYAAVATVLG